MSRPKCTSDFKLKMVKQFLNSELSAAKFATKYNLNTTSLRAWARLFKQHGNAGFAVEQNNTTRYDLAFKLSVLETMKKENLSLIAATSRFNIGGRSTISRWLKLYEAGDLNALENKSKRIPMSVSPPKKPNFSKKSFSDKNLTPEQKIELFEQQNKELEYLRAENAYLKKLDALMKSKRSVTKKKR